MKNLLQKLCFTAMCFSTLYASAQTQVPKLNSLAAAQPTIFLDFDGQTVQTAAWQSGNAFVCAPSTLSNTQITEVFNRVSEDYRPFAINITTDSAKFLAAPPLQRVRIIVTPTSAWYPNAGGVTYTGCFTWGGDIPGFVFIDKLAYNPKFVGECCTHESGHSLGLSHQAKYDAFCTLTEPYNTGIGLGETSWAPVMGNSYAKNMTGWNDGPTPYDCSLLQDNLTIITTQNGFTYRTDDYTETLDATAANLNPVSFNMPGIISTPADRDAFRLVITQNGTIHLEAAPYNLGASSDGTPNDGANLDILMTLYNSSGAVIRAYNPLGSMNVSADTILNIGTYYVTISGTGNNNTGNYGSLGSYSFTGFRGALPIHSVSLHGSNAKNSHLLNWEIIADEPIATQVLEKSDDGLNFEPIMTANGSVNNFTYTPTKNGTTYYRLKATSVIYQTMFSNLVVLKTTGNTNLFSVSTLVQQSIHVNASGNYQYVLLDANARVLASGQNQKGSSMINTDHLSKGMYILQMMSDNYKQTERIIKQ